MLKSQLNARPRGNKESSDKAHSSRVDEKQSIEGGDWAPLSSASNKARSQTRPFGLRRKTGSRVAPTNPPDEDRREAVFSVDVPARSQVHMVFVWARASSTLKRASEIAWGGGEA